MNFRNYSILRQKMIANNIKESMIIKLSCRNTYEFKYFII